VSAAPPSQTETRFTATLKRVLPTAVLLLLAATLRVQGEQINKVRARFEGISGQGGRG
jgi:hypothetical protein